MFGGTLPRELSSIPEFASLMVAYRQRYIMDRSMPELRQWNGIVSLNDLFESEVVPAGTSPEQYFDQRFINYLHKQTGDLHNIHWRQFEFLTAEYFRRNNYRVSVTKPRKDGGFDIAVERSNLDFGPDVILIDCKRNAEDSPVDLQTVKAFWSTVSDEGATKGLIATTSRLTRDAQDWCKRDARRYRLQAADGDRVRQWLASLASI
jgi:restriction system protein